MMENIKMLVVLTLIAGLCGLLLASVNTATKDQIVEMKLKYVQGPAVMVVLKGADNEATLIQDRKTVTVDEKEMVVFVGKKGGKLNTIAFESFGSGFGGDVGVMVGYQIDGDKVAGIGVTSHSETPGIGSRVKEESYTKKYKDKPVTANFKLKSEAGDIDALSGATVSSSAVSQAVQNNVELYKTVKEMILKL